MRKDELISSFYDEYGYIPNEDELNDYGNGNDDNYHSQPNFRSSVKHTQSEFEFEPTDDLIIELRDTFKFIASKAKKSLKEKQDDLINDDNLDEFNYMVMSFLLKGALYFVLKKSFEKGYHFNELS